MRPKLGNVTVVELLSVCVSKVLLTQTSDIVLTSDFKNYCGTLDWACKLDEVLDIADRTAAIYVVAEMIADFAEDADGS